ncbi:hypothetical protein DOY81_005419 [Sarcophaga bullata]|nr:hypothetical protein DOY81_005419 [Sarcophaga bullata]
MCAITKFKAYEIKKNRFFYKLKNCVILTYLHTTTTTTTTTINPQTTQGKQTNKQKKEK